MPHASLHPTADSTPPTPVSSCDLLAYAAGAANSTSCLQQLYTNTHAHSLGYCQRVAVKTLKLRTECEVARQHHRRVSSSRRQCSQQLLAGADTDSGWWQRCCQTAVVLQPMAGCQAEQQHRQHSVRCCCFGRDSTTLCFTAHHARCGLR